MTSVVNFTGGTVNVAGVTFDYNYSSNSTGATFNLSAQDVHGQPAKSVIHLANGTYSGTYRGTGTGSVTTSGQFASILVPSNAQMTLDFPSDMFQLDTFISVRSGATVTNLPNSTINLGPNGGDNQGWFLNGTGTFVNQGTIIKALGTRTAFDNGLDNFINDRGTIDVESGKIGFNSNFSFSGGTLIVAAGSQLDLSVPNGSFSGTFTGSGGGVVSVDLGTLKVGMTGATFDFPPGLFQWRGGTFNIPAGASLTNLGSLQLNGATVKNLDGGGTLVNRGTMVHNDAGNLEIDNGSSLSNQSSGVYKLQSTGDITEGGSGTNTFVNGGSLAMISPGSASIAVGSFSNPGIVYAYVGNLAIASPVVQVSSGTLTGGTWFVNSGATLDLSLAGDIITNNALVVLNGPNADFKQLAALGTNNGELLLKKGASFTTGSDFTNNGMVTLLAGTTFNVTGNFTQAAAGLINLEVRGAPGTNQYGLFNVSGSANLAGTLNAQLTNSFVPSAGQSFKIMTFASLVSPFAKLTTRPPSAGVSFTPKYAATELDLVV